MLTMVLCEQHSDIACSIYILFLRKLEQVQGQVGQVYNQAKMWMDGQRLSHLKGLLSINFMYSSISHVTLVYFILVSNLKHPASDMQ